MSVTFVHPTVNHKTCLRGYKRTHLASRAPDYDVDDKFCLRYADMHDFPDSYYTEQVIRGYDFSGTAKSFDKTIYYKLQLCVNCTHFFKNLLYDRSIAIQESKPYSFANFQWDKTSFEFQKLFTEFTKYYPVLESEDAQGLNYMGDYVGGFGRIAQRMDSKYGVDLVNTPPILINEDQILPKTDAWKGLEERQTPFGKKPTVEQAKPMTLRKWQSKNKVQIKYLLSMMQKENSLDFWCKIVNHYDGKPQL
jgi:hypothetical protein